MKGLKIGDKAWMARTEYSSVHVKCPDCLGSGQLTVRFADGKEVSIACSNCARGYELPTGRVSYNQHREVVAEITISGVNETLEKTEYYFNQHSYVDECYVFSSKADADACAVKLAGERTLNEMNAFNAKIKDHKSWAWHASYYRSCLKRAEQDVLTYTAKLNHAKLKQGVK